MEITYDDLLLNVKKYMHKETDLEIINRAYEFAYKKHDGQLRKSGSPYISHPVAVAHILSELRVGPITICAGLLHDVVEDTDITVEEIAEMFGEDISLLVDGLTKVSKLKFSSLEKQQANNHQKMLLAMGKDIRVIVIKLADRLHNMRTLDSMAVEKQIRISRETLEIYSPLAHKLGMFKIKAELEDRALKYTDSSMYSKITYLTNNKMSVKDFSLDDMIERIKSNLDDSNVEEYEIKGRTKNKYSIYKKMISQNKEFEDIYDVLAIRIVVEKIEYCYQVLGVIHAHFTPIPKRFKDYIAVPKQNMYQSLHTTVIGTNGETFEVQIRTYDMDRVAEYGIAAHWSYKENVGYSKEKEQFEIAQKLKWYSDLLKISDEEDNTAEELVETFKGDILDANIYVYTPKSEVVALPKGATPLDFAYKIHTDVGNKTVGAIVNGKIVPLSYELKTGDIISMKTNKNSFGPSEDWMKIVKTNHAKHKIRGFLNKQNRDVLVSMGKNELEREFQIANRKREELSDTFVKNTFGKNGLTCVDDVYAEIGKGLLSAKTVEQKLAGNSFYDREQSLQKQIEKTQRILTTHSETGVVVEGLTNPQIKLANCCFPIPNDEILGFVSKGNGLVVHRADCNNLDSLDKNRLLKLEWATEINRKYQVCIKIIALQSNTLVSEVINVINAHSVNIASINAINNSRLESIVNLKLLLSDTNVLSLLIVNLKKISNITNIERV